MNKKLTLVKDQLKELPNNIEAEQSVIGSILVSNEIFDEINLIISNKNFYDPMHQKIFNAIEKLIFSGMLAIGENLTEYRSSGDAFNRDDEDLFRVLGQTSWQYALGHFLEARFAYQEDHSGMKGTGSLVSSNDRDEEDGDLLWLGVRTKGNVYNDILSEDKPISYRADLMYLTGDEDVQSTTSGPNDAVRTVTGVSNNDVSGWGVDLGLEVPLPVYQEPVLILGYAFGSGDENSADNDNDAFRQTGLDGNTSKFGVSSGSMYNYGSVLRPDLSNIHITTLGLGVPLFKASGPRRPGKLFLSTLVGVQECYKTCPKSLMLYLLPSCPAQTEVRQ